MNSQDKIIIYQSDGNTPQIKVHIDSKTAWLTQAQLVELYGSSKSNVSEHIKHIFEDNELSRNSVVRNFRITATDGKQYNTDHYNLDMIISLGYRINSKTATAFRIWATQRLKEYIVKGFALDDDRLKNLGGGDYFKELLARIRDIRSSEKMLYRQVLDLYATATDYDPKSTQSIKFFKIVQNKLHYATHKQTAAEVIHDRADANKKFMGLTVFAGDLPVLEEVRIAKNYLTAEELEKLNRLVSAFFDLAELKAIDRIPMKMSDYIKELDKLTRNYGKGVLLDAGKISHKQAVQKAEKEYRKFQTKTLNTVEKSYLDILRKIEKKTKRKEVKK